MDSYFTALSKRQTMLLLTAVTYGGQDVVSLFDFLPKDTAELLQERAKALLQIPREKRIPLLVQEMKRLVTARRNQFWSVEPLRLVSLLQNERTALIEVLSRALPAKVTDAVKNQLRRPKVRLRREVKPEVLDVLRLQLEQQLLKVQSPRAVFKFSDILLLQTRELITVCDRVGAKRMAKAIAGLPEEDRTAFVDKLPGDTRRLMQKALDGLDSAPLAEAQARALMERFGVDESPAEGIRMAGVHRLARACLAQSPEFAARVVERHRGEFGQRFASTVREERRDPPDGDAGRVGIVRDLEKLEQEGIIDRPMRLPPPPRLEPPASPGRARRDESTLREPNPMGSDEEPTPHASSGGPRGPTGHSS